MNPLSAPEVRLAAVSERDGKSFCATLTVRFIGLFRFAIAAAKATK